MKIITHPTNGRKYARLKTGNPAHPYVKMTLGTKSAEEARRKAKSANLAKIEAALQAGALSQQAIARLTVGRKLNLQAAAAQWLAAAPKRGEAPATTATNEGILAHWFAFAPDVAGLAPLSLRTDHVYDFINRPDPAVGRQRRLRQLAALRMFFRYCVDLGLTSANVASQVEVNHRELSHAQRETRTILPFTAAEVRRIVENETGWWRWATAISAATGLRLGDVATLEHATLATPRHIAVWTDKRDRRVLLPVNDRLTPGLAAVLAEIPPTDSPFLFPEQAAQYDDVKAGRPKFSIYFARVLDKLGIDRQAGRKSFHSLRHTAITRWEKAGFSLDECKDFAGHADAKTTQGYLHE